MLDGWSDDVDLHVSVDDLPRDPSVDSQIDMRRYIIIFLALITALCVPLAAIIIYLAAPFDAMTTPAQLAAIQAQRPETIILPVDLRFNAAFKLPRVAEVQPEIVCFGSSRAGGFRAGMFAPHRFYNMSYTGWTTNQVLDIFDRTTRETHPRVVILELDYFLFANHWQQWFEIQRTMIHDRPFRYAMESLGSYLRAVLANRAPFDAYRSAPTRFIGPESIRGASGFRSDGSYENSQTYIAYAQAHYLNAEHFVGTVPPDYEMSPSLQAPIERLAALARERGIKLVGVQLPLLRSGIELLDHDQSYGPRAGAWRAFESPANRAWLANLGIPLFDLARSPVDDDPADFIDSVHLSDRGMEKAMAELQADPAFRAAIDPDPPAANSPPAR
jgi:hypothetical protein